MVCDSCTICHCLFAILLVPLVGLFLHMYNVCLIGLRGLDALTYYHYTEVMCSDTLYHIVWLSPDDRTKHGALLLNVIQRFVTPTRRHAERLIRFQ